MAKPTIQQLKSSQPVALTPLERGLADLLADMLVLDVQAERLVSEGEPTVTDTTH